MEHSANKRSTANGNDCSSFLWNQLVSGAPVVLGLDAYRPPTIRIKEQVLNAAFRTTLDKRVEQSVPSSLAGTVQFSAENDGIVVVLDQLPGCTPSPLRPNIVQVSCKFDKAGPGNSSGTTSKEEWLSKLTSFEDAWDYASLECGLGFKLAISADLAARTRGPSCDLAVAAVTPILPLRLVPLFPVPVLRSGVQDALSSPHTAAVPDFGFVTLCGDHLCFHFKHQLEDGGFSFIGVWISGVASIEHPFIWLVCAQFATSQRLASRPKEIFAVCVLPSPRQPAAAVAVGGVSSEEVLFYNCLCPNPASLCFQLWQGAATTSVARVPLASNKTIAINLEKVLSGSAAETFHAALKELLKTRAPLAASLERSNSAVAHDSWVPTPRPARSQAFNMAPTVPDISDCSVGLASGHSRSENMNANPGATYAPGTNPLEAATQPFAAECSNGALSAQTATVASATAQYGAMTTPAQGQGQQFNASGNMVAAQFSPPQQHHWPSAAAERHCAEGLVPAAVYNLIRHQDEQLQELRLQIQRLLNPAEEPGLLRTPDPTPQRLESGLCRRAVEKSTREAATMTETASSVRLVHRSVQTDKMAIEGSSSDQLCTLCGHHQQGARLAREVPERDTDYTIFFPEKSPHLLKQQLVPHRPGPRPAHLVSPREPAESLPRPAFAHSRTSDSLLTSAVSFRDDLCVPQDCTAEKRGSKAETFIHPRLQYEEESRLGPSVPGRGRDELSMQVDRIAQKYCPGAGLPPTSPHPTAKGGTPLSVASQAYLRNYGLADARPARGDAGDSMERILDISALKRLPKLL